MDVHECSRPWGWRQVTWYKPLLHISQCLTSFVKYLSTGLVGLGLLVRYDSLEVINYSIYVEHNHLQRDGWGKDMCPSTETLCVLEVSHVIIHL